MATYQESYERNRRFNEAKKELMLELLKDPNSKRVYDLKCEINSLRLGSLGTQTRSINRMMPWIKC